MAQCHKKGYAVHFLTTRKTKIVSKPSYTGFYWNPKIGEIDADCLNGVSVIINLAGASISKRWTTGYKKEVLNSRLQTLATLYALLESAPQPKVVQMISASAIGIYPTSLSKLYEEDASEVDDSFLGEVVAAWEAKTNEFTKLGVTVSKVRIGLVLSTNGGALPEMARPVKYFAGAAFGSGEQWQSWIHIADLARLFLFLAENRVAGTFNGVAPNPVTNSKLVKEIAKVLERPLFLPNIPKFAMQLILGEMSYILFASQRVSSKKIEEEGFVFEYRNICTALADIYNTNSDCDTEETSLQNQYVK